MNLHDRLIKQNIDVHAFIDKRADEIIQIKGIPVYFSEISSIENKDEYLVIVAVKNVFDHEEIVDLLKINGFFNILYRPLMIIEGGKESNLLRINELYTVFFEGILEDKLEIPVIKEKRKNIFKDESFITNLDDGCRLFYIPMELAYTDKPKNSSFNSWRDLNIHTVITYFNLYDLFEGKDKSTGEIYIEFCKKSALSVGNTSISKRWEENVFRNRHMIYKKLSENLNLDVDFFKRNAPEVTWNESKGYFNLEGCKHRTSFLAYKGYDYLIVRSKNDDFNKWLNKPILNKIIKKYSGADFYNYFTAVEHPYFYKIDFATAQIYKENFKFVVRYLSGELYKKYKVVNFKKISILDVNFDTGFFARNINKMNSKIEKFFTDENLINIFQDINELVYIKNIKSILCEVNDFSRYNIICIKYGNNDDYLNYIFNQSLKNKLMIILITPQKRLKGVIDNVIKENKGYKYISLNNYFYNNQIFNLGVFSYG